jgi:HAD superfamily phosphoserine phosphatase-like hydrolase
MDKRRREMKFIFDLDGTVTSKETLPIISQHFGVSEEISKLTEETIAGNIPFIESFIRRVHILGKLPVSEVSNLLGEVPLSKNVLKFIQENKKDCVIATGNFEGWIKKITEKIGCEYFSSNAIVENDKISKLTYILKKEEIVRKLKSQGEMVVFIGDGNNDAEAMREADISIACGLIHWPAKSVLSVADYAVFDEKALCRLLNQIHTKPKGKSVVLSSAGIGSRLGLGQTKALIKINEKPLIHYQIESFKTVEDVRVVIGFQAAEVIESVMKIRKDIIFVYNHDYFHTKTGASYYLGARHGNEYAIAWDGDLLVHPDDISKCLTYEGEFVGCSATITDDAVFVRINEETEVTSFSRQSGDYEWSGPACLKRSNIKYVSNHVFLQIEDLLPIPALVIRAQDIDTYEDYKRAEIFMKSWNSGNKSIDDYYRKMGANIQNPSETRNKSKDFSSFDIEFMKKLSNKNKTLLDLGAGTGLLINNLENDFKHIVAVEKYPDFSKFINKSAKINVINEDLLTFDTDDVFDYVSIFGVMNFFNYSEAKLIYEKAITFLNKDGMLIIKHQMGVDEDVIIDGHSEELDSYYYSEYRKVENEIKLLEKIGFIHIEKIDIYPDEYNRWSNTHFYALVCKKG